MKCPHCNSFNKEEAKFCKNCGKPLNKQSLAYHDKFGDSKVENTVPVEESSSKNTLIICITVVICALIVAGALIYVNTNNDNVINSTSDNLTDESVNNQSEAPIEPPAKSWQLVETISGSGTGTDISELPSGKIKVKITAFPIKNYGTNYLEVYSSTGNSVSVDWDSKSAVKSKTNSMILEVNEGDTISVDYYELESWKIDIYNYV